MSQTDQRPVGVTKLAQLVRCEQQLIFDQQYGPVRPRERERLARAGTAEHSRHDRLARRYQSSKNTRDPRCFVASAVYGESAWQTEVLRRWRDQALRPTRWGRYWIRLYYKISPPLAQHLTQHPGIAHAVRWLLDRWIQRAGWGLEEDEQ